VKRRAIVAVAVLFVAIVWGRALWGASTARAGWNPPSGVLIAATEQTERGKGLFAMNCAKCHGDQGQGTGDGPKIIGTPNPLASYMTAQGVFDFASKEMPADAPGSLMPQVYWDVLAFILESNKALPPDTILGPDNAANIRLAP
jgi:mono/diheme cytochrome c family protein